MTLSYLAKTSMTLNFSSDMQCSCVYITFDYFYPKLS